MNARVRPVGEKTPPVVAAAELPPLVEEVAIQVLRSRRDESGPRSDGDGREQLAELLRSVAGAIDPERRPDEAVLAALAAAALAEAHELDRVPGRPPCAAALDLVAWIRREWRQALRPRVLRLLESVVDGVAVEGGRRRFVREVRRLLARAERWRPDVVDVDRAATIRFGGRPATYKATKGGLAVRLPLGAGNNEGRLVLLLADGRPPTDAHPAVVSRATTAVRLASRGVVTIERGRDGLALVPQVVLTRRARLEAQRVRALRARPRRC